MRRTRQVEIPLRSFEKLQDLRNHMEAQRGVSIPYTQALGEIIAQAHKNLDRHRAANEARAAGHTGYPEDTQ